MRDQNFWSVTSGLHFVLKALYFHSWRRLLLLDGDNDTPTSSRIFLTSLDILKLIFLTMKTLVVICGVAKLTNAFLLFKNEPDY